MLGQLLQLATTTAVRACPVPDDLAAVTTIGTEHPGERAAEVEAIWSRVEGVYRSGMHPAIQLCIRHRGDVVLDRSIGYARGVRPGRPLDPERLVPITTETPVNLFSAGKAITAMAMHLLEEQGALGLDDPVATHLPGFERHDKGRITLRQVLTHRAGIPSIPREALDLDLLDDHDRIVELLCDLHPVTPPGGPPAYHAISGGFVMEAVARQTTGRSLREILATEIKVPLGLRWFDLGVSSEDAELVAHNIVTGVPLPPPISMLAQRLLGMGWDEAVLISNDHRFQSGVIPSGNLIVTARDTAAFYQCLLDGGVLDGTRVFRSDTIERAVRADRGIDIDRMIGLPLRYGTGFMLGTDTISLYGWNHPRAFGHLGLSNSFTWADPDRDLVVALLTTGKAVIGTHLPAVYNLVSEIHRSFPVAH